LDLKDSITLGEGRGNNFIVFLKRRRKEIAVEAVNSKRYWNLRGDYTRRPGERSESHWKKMIGKSRLSGRKPNVRFDEGELEIELLATTPALYSTEVGNHRLVQVAHHFFYNPP
jgi:hypothetical protein